MTEQEIISTNIYLSWICQELCIEPAITTKKADVTPNGYINIHYTHFSDVDGHKFAQDFEEILDESFRHAEVYVSDNKEGEWFDLHISFKYDPIKNVVYKAENLRE